LALPRYHITERRAVAFDADVLDEEPVERRRRRYAIGPMSAVPSRTPFALSRGETRLNLSFEARNLGELECALKIGEMSGIF
jgi:hypothetical protein